MDVRERFERAKLVRELYPEFRDFCRDAMEFLGFDTTWMQEDIAEFLQYGPDNLMVQAQRGEAKSTIACIFGVWCLTQDPKTRVMLISGSQAKADENGKLMHGLIHNWDILAYLIPDKYAGDRVSVVEFDVHYSLKGVDKSASVNCMGITASLQGYRADILIPDDIETTKNGLTAVQRAHLETLSKEFTSICTAGRIIYLGTPQTKDSIYNNLARRGFCIRVWPGRFPTEAQETRYKDCLAPSIIERMHLLGPRCRTGGGLDGTRGMPTDPQRFNEDELQRKEMDQGPETFELQFMLNSALLDALRNQLKLRDFIVGDYAHDSVPELVQWAGDPRYRVQLDNDFPVRDAEMYRAASASEHFTKPKNITMVVDPASNGGDELAFCIGGAVGPFVHVMAWGGYRGGFAETNLEKLAQLVQEFSVTQVFVEKNMGAGAVTQLLMNYFNSIDPETGKRRITGVGVEDLQSTGQKERRIIDTIRPILQRHRLVLHMRAIEMDTELLKQHSADKRFMYSGLYQLQNITTDRGSLNKDDRLDTLEMLCRQLVGFLVKDEEKEKEHREKAAAKEFFNNPMGTAHLKQRSRQPGRTRLVRRR